MALSKVNIDTNIPPCTDYYQNEMLQNERGLKLFYQRFLPKNEVKAIVIFVHGVQEHSSRYNHVLISLAEDGIAGISYDHQAHGRSDKVEGRRATCKSFQEFVDDLKLVIDNARKAIKADVPLFIWGQSFGGCVTANFILQNEDYIGDKGGVVLTSPYLGKDLNLVEKMQLTIGTRLAKYFPHLPVVKAVKVQDMSKDPRAQKDYSEDPLNLIGDMRLYLSLSINDAAANVMENAEKVNSNLLIMFGDTDRCCSLEYARKYFDKVSSSNKKFKVFDGLYHTMFHEPEQKKIIEYMRQHILNTIA